MLELKTPKSKFIHKHYPNWAKNGGILCGYIRVFQSPLCTQLLLTPSDQREYYSRQLCDIPGFGPEDVKAAYCQFNEPKYFYLFMCFGSFLKVKKSIGTSKLNRFFSTESVILVLR